MPSKAAGYLYHFAELSNLYVRQHQAAEKGTGLGGGNPIHNHYKQQENKISRSKASHGRERLDNEKLMTLKKDI